MTIKYFDNRAIMIEYDRNTICITDAYNGFRFTMDTSMKEYFVPCIERISKLCYLFDKGNIPTHKYVAVNYRGFNNSRCINNNKHFFTW